MSKGFIHVVATVDIEDNSGNILYVNPVTASQGAASQEADTDRVLLVVENAQGEELIRKRPILRIEACDIEAEQKGLVQADIPLVKGMRAIKLLVNGNLVATFKPGKLEPSVPQGMALGMVSPNSASPNKMTIESLSAIEPEEGISYTVQVKSENQTSWRTLAVGQKVPHADVNVSQFPGSKKLSFRMLRSNGFEQAIIFERTIDMES